MDAVNFHRENLQISTIIPFRIIIKNCTFFFLSLSERAAFLIAMHQSETE